jgi:putative flavoprotein involved in K+ transport
MSHVMNDVVVVGAGQSGLAAARALKAAGLAPIVLEAGPEPVGSWPHYYDSLKLFSPAAYSAFPGFPFRGDPDRYPPRDEVVDYLREYATTLDADIRTGCRVSSVASMGDRGFLVTTDTGEAIRTAGVVAATGSFGSPHLPSLFGQRRFTGRVLHVADYVRPEPYVDQRVVVVGAGDSAVQIGYELAAVARVTLATRRPLAFLPQRIGGKDLHYWLERTGFDDLPPEWLARLIPDTLVTDTGRYRAAVESGRPDRRPMFTALDGEHVVWSDGTREVVDTIVLATGYRPHLDYLRGLGALTDGLPLHAGGISTTHPGLAYVGIEFQRSYASNTLRGVHRDAEYIAPAIAAHIRDAGALVRPWKGAVHEPPEPGGELLSLGSRQDHR